MNLKKRDCPIECNIIVNDWFETVELTLNGEKHRLESSALVGSNICDLIDCLYRIQIEIVDENYQGYRVDTENHSKDDPRIITDMVANLDFDPEGADTYMRMHRELYNNPDNIIDVEITYPDSHEFKYKVSFYDLCYAVAKATTSIIKKYGLSGFHYKTEMDSIDVLHFLNVKHLGLFKKPLSPYYENFSNKKTDIVSFTDEIELLLFDM